MEPSRGPDAGMPSSEVSAAGPTSPEPVPAQSFETAAKVKEPLVRRLRRVVVLVLAVTALLVLGGTAAAFVYYDRATAPDRSSPHAAVDNYLRAYLRDHDDKSAAQYTCSDRSGLAPVVALRGDIESRERQFSMTATFSWNVLGEAPGNGGTAVSADIVVSAVIGGKEQRALEHWEFLTHDENGWRVCSGHEVI